MNLGKESSRLVVYLLLAALLGSASSALGAETGTIESQERVRGYLGAGGGVVKMKNGNDVFALAIAPDTTGTGSKAFIGIEIEPHSAIELAYIDFGKFTNANATLSYNDTWEAKAVNLGYVGGASINKNLSFHFRIGAFYWKVEDKFTLLGAASSSVERGTDMSFGLGMQINFGRWVAARIELEQFMDLGDNRTTGQSSLQLISANLLFRI